jgi:hypothetical protein
MHGMDFFALGMVKSRPFSRRVVSGRAGSFTGHDTRWQPRGFYSLAETKVHWPRMMARTDGHNGGSLVGSRKLLSKYQFRFGGL